MGVRESGGCLSGRAAAEAEALRTPQPTGPSGRAHRPAPAQGWDSGLSEEVSQRKPELDSCQSSKNKQILFTITAAGEKRFQYRPDLRPGMWGLTAEEQGATGQKICRRKHQGEGVQAYKPNRILGGSSHEGGGFWLNQLRVLAKTE